MIDLILDGVWWFRAGLAVGVVAAVASVRGRRPGERARASTIRALGLLFGCVIGVLGAGHLTAITIHAAQHTLTNPMWAVALYPLGLALAIPAWWLVALAGSTRCAPDSRRGAMIALNSWLCIVLLASSGGKNPLAALAALNMIPLLSANRWALRAAAGAAGLVYAAMGVASVFATGRQF